MTSAPLPLTTPGDAAAKTPWNPRLVVFACNWCSYAGADTAGVSRIQQQPQQGVLHGELGPIVRNALAHLAIAQL